MSFFCIYARIHRNLIRIFKILKTKFLSCFFLIHILLWSLILIIKRSLSFMIYTLRFFEIFNLFEFFHFKVIFFIIYSWKKLISHFRQTILLINRLLLLLLIFFSWNLYHWSFIRIFLRIQVKNIIKTIIDFKILRKFFKSWGWYIWIFFHLFIKNLEVSLIALFLIIRKL